MPMTDDTHTDAAVVKPRVENPSCKMTPAAQKADAR